MKYLNLLFLIKTAVTLMILIQSTPTQGQTAQVKSERPANIILMIGDGMGLAQIHAARLAQETQLHMQQLTEIGFMTTHSYDNGVTDSGAGGTAIATGQKTRNGMIGMSHDSIPVPSMLDIFASKGLATGIVVTCAVTHATPASFVAKNINRNNYEEIALDYVKAPIDVVIGGGIKHFAARKDNRNLEAELIQKGYHVYRSLEEVNADKYYILTDSVHPPTMINNRGNYLSEATSLAINTLSKDESGFFLMIEGSQIDWAGHDNDSAYLVQETIDFDHAVGEALKFAAQNGNTLVIVTADHETGGLTLSGSYKSSGLQPKLKFTSDDHTAVMVPVMAFGPGAERFRGFYDNVDLFQKITTLMNN